MILLIVFSFLCMPLISSLYIPTDSQSNILSIIESHLVIDSSTSYPRIEIQGTGSNWKLISGQNTFFVNFSTRHPSVWPSISLVYVNHLQSPVSVHLHGLTPPYTLDGVPFISSLPIQPQRTQKIQMDR